MTSATSRRPARTPRTLFFAAAMVLVASALASTAAFAQRALENEAELERGAVADATPQQRYQSAIREAGGGLKVSLAECGALAGAERAACQGQARARYQADMAAARRLLRGDPSAGPVNVVGGPIRSTETTYVIQK